MDISFVAQPFAGEPNLRTFVEAAVDDPRIERFTALAAWAKYSGLARLRDRLEAFRARGGTARLIVGIDEGGATEQGLRLALELFDSVHVLFDVSGRTFHPKVYLFEGPGVARVFVGSNNLTAGGVFYNYEGGVQLVLDPETEEGSRFAGEVNGYVERLYGDTAVCKELDDALLHKLVADPRYRIRDERSRRRAPAGAPADDVDTRLELDGTTTPFGSSAQEKEGWPAAGGTAGVPAPIATPPAPQPVTSPAPSSVVAKRWFRALSPSDAQQPPGAATAVTGSLKLNRAGHPIDQTTYFRHDFFGGLPWTSEQGLRRPKETTAVPFQVTIGGKDLGVFDLNVDHAGYREAGQGNVTTWLHWGPLNPVMRATDYTGHYVVLERLGDGSFTLEITPARPAAFSA